jgi:hypothetical protein
MHESAIHGGVALVQESKSPARRENAGLAGRISQIFGAK